MTFADMANRLIRFSPKKHTEAYRNTTTMPKNVPGRVDMLDAIKRGMGRPKRGPRDYPMPGRVKV